MLIKLPASRSIKNQIVPSETADCEREYHIRVTNVKKETSFHEAAWRARARCVSQKGALGVGRCATATVRGMELKPRAFALGQPASMGSQDDPAGDLAFTQLIQYLVGLSKRASNHLALHLPCRSDGEYFAHFLPSTNR